MNAKEAAEAMGFNPGTVLDEKAVHERYRSLAAKLHPDAGGTAEAFQELMHARNTLISTFKRTTGSPRPPVAEPPTKCAACDGCGSVELRKAWHTVRVQCRACKGAGVVKPSGV